MNYSVILENVSKSFGDKKVLQNCSVTFEAGITTAVLGASGSGKTTLMRIAAGLLLPDSGTVVRDKELSLSFVFQDDRLLPWYTALENVMFAGISREIAVDVLDSLGLGAELSSLPSELSGGMCRRVAIARALAYNGDVYFLDEPLRGLDKSTAQQVLAVLKNTIKGKTVLLVTHNAEESSLLAQSTVTLG